MRLNWLAEDTAKTIEEGVRNYELAMDILPGRNPEGKLAEKLKGEIRWVEDGVENMLREIREFRDRAQKLKEFCLINYSYVSKPVEELGEDT